MSPEKELIRICRSMVSETFHLPHDETWKHRDFEYLSDLILEKTNVRISVSTLKRIWKDDARMPQTYTLNALAGLLDYPGWSEFKRSHIGHLIREVPEKASPLKRKIPSFRWIYPGVAVGVLLLIAAIIYAVKRGNITGTNIVFSSRKNLASGVPNTVAFEYDISHLDFDSAFIQHTWDKRLKARVSQSNHVQTFIYYYPGYHQAKLIIDGQVVKTQSVNIQTNGWQALIDGMGEKIPRYVPSGGTFKQGKLYISKRGLLDSDIPVSNTGFFVNYFNVGHVENTDSKNFTFETTLKNNVEEGALVCQYTQLTLICENGMISVPFCNPGCTSAINLHVSDVFMSGKKNDLSAFGVDLGHWTPIKIESAGKQVRVLVNNKNIFNLRYTTDLGKITGFHFKFYGCGAVAAVKLYNGEGKVGFSDDF